MAHPRNKHESKLVKKQRGHHGHGACKCSCCSFTSLDKTRARKFKRRNRATAARFADEGIVRGNMSKRVPQFDLVFGSKQVRDPLPMLK